MKEKLTNWFNPYDPKHLEAYSSMCENGFWPEGFIPEHIDMSKAYLDIIELQAMLANCWVRFYLMENK